jgi:hypothetical protein
MALSRRLVLRVLYAGPSEQVTFRAFLATWAGFK